MIKTFTSFKAYVEFLTSLQFEKGEVFCYNFIPSAFFPKDIIDLYFDRNDPTPHHSAFAEMLWQYGKKVLKHYQSGDLTIVIESGTMRSFVEKGLVHEAVSGFEVGYSTRAKALELLESKGSNSSLYVIPYELPFVFRLHPPDGVLIDVRKNSVEQGIQGIWIEDAQTFSSFEDEVKRQQAAALSRKAVKAAFKELIPKVKSGQKVEWNHACNR